MSYDSVHKMIFRILLAFMVVVVGVALSHQVITEQPKADAYLDDRWSEVLSE